MVFLGFTRLLTSSIQADRLESQMRVQLEIQEGIDLRLEQRDEELHQLWSQSQADGAQLAALSLQLQELISSVESRAEVVGKDLEEINGQFDRHRGEINRLKIREKDAKEETEKLKGFIIGAGHEAQVFKDRLDRMEEISEELAFICEDLDGLLREADEERARELQEGPSSSVVRSPP